MLCGSRILIKPIEIFQLKKKCGHSGYSSPASGWKRLSLSTPPAKDLVMGKGWGVRLAFFLFLCFLPFPWAGCLPLRPLPGWKNWERRVKDHNSHVSWVTWYLRLFLGFFRRPLLDPSNSIFLELGNSSLACYIVLCPWLFRGSFQEEMLLLMFSNLPRCFLGQDLQWLSTGSLLYCLVWPMRQLTAGWCSDLSGAVLCAHSWPFLRFLVPVGCMFIVCRIAWSTHQPVSPGGWLKLLELRRQTLFSPSLGLRPGAPPSFLWRNPIKIHLLSTLWLLFVSSLDWL